ncbi:MAG: hypothetical protein M5U33_06230 [Pseudorhodoplanes sp.]|nr:hypothetical protein [Pseudorhodoplanes sp.]
MVGVIAIGRRSAPVEIVTCPSSSMRMASSAPTRLTRLARSSPVSKATTDTATSAFGALAITAPSASRISMSRMRTAARP